MKSKDMIMLGLAMVLFAGTAVFGYQQLSGKNKAATKTVKVEVITPIKPEFDENALKLLGDSENSRNFVPPFDLTTIGNPKPFNPL